MALISQDEIAALRANINIVDVINSYIPLDHKGKNYFGVCPFHSDHSPSMSVSEEKQIYKCFSCGAAGNVFSFVQNYENITFYEAVEQLASKYNFSLSAKITSNKVDKNAILYEIMDVAAKLFNNNIKTEYGKTALEYLKNRGLDKNVINDFNIGLALKQKDMLFQILKQKKYKEEDIQKVGLINNLDTIYDNFINRIIFPLHDSNGKVIGFSGRLYDGSEGPKYLNTKETLLFKKGQMLFNYHRAKKEAKLAKSIIIVEGYMDAIRLYINGVKNVIAIMGTTLTDEQISLLKKLNCKIILCLDNDDAGQNAIYEVGKNLNELNFEVEVIQLSDYKDPDEYILNLGIDAFNRNLKEPLKYLDFSLNYLKKNRNLNETVELAEYVNEVLKDLSKESDPILIDITLKRLCSDYNLEYELLKDKINKFENLELEIKKKKESSKIEVQNIKNDNKYNKNVRNLLFFMMNSEKYVKIYQENLVFLNNLDYREISKEILYYYELNGKINLADFLSFALKNESVYKIILDIINEYSDIELTQSIFLDLINSIQKDNNKNTIKELKKQLKEEMDKNKKIEIATKIAEIKKGSV